MIKGSNLRGLVAGSAVVGVSVFFTAGCLPSGATNGSLLSVSAKSQSQTGGADDGNFQVIPAGAAFSLTGSMNASVNLGAKSSQNYALHSGSFSGSVRITIEHEEVSEVDKKSQISFSVTPSVITVAPNSNYNFTVNIATTQSAPDLALHYHVVARDASGTIRKETEMETEFAVMPIFEITVGAGNAMNKAIWSTDLVNAGTGIGAKQPANFVAHAAGVTIRYINMDPAGPHIIHGSGLIPHQNTNTRLRSLASGAVNPAGQTYIDAYEVKVTSKTANASGGYYLHDGESSAKSGVLKFNVDAASVKPPVVDATATFAKVNTLLQNSCVSCHSATNAQSDVDLSTFAKVATKVVPFDAASSALYTSVLANMPLSGTPFTTTEKDLIKNWINNGALNN